LNAVVISALTLPLLAAAGCTKAANPPAVTESPSTSETPPLATEPVAAGIAPLTGLPVGDPAVLARPALIAKIDNVKAARPQAGLNQADLVIETPVEGGLTRLFTVFHSTDAAMVGPVRSARPVDTSLLRMLSGGVFVYSGGVAGTLNDIKTNSGAAMVSSDASEKYFVVRKDRVKGHDVFGSTDRLYAVGLERKPELKAPKPLFTYSGTVPPGEATSRIDLNFAGNRSAWAWGGSSWLRDQDGTRDQLEDGTQASATNVVVLSVGITMTAGKDAAGNGVPLPGVIGSGNAWVFRDGLMVKGTWTRHGDDQPFTLRDQAGKAIALAAGRTWIELLPTPNQPKVTP
jgi:hypothetical protein